MRPLYLVLGMLATATGIVGIALPLLPTAPFLLLAAFCFARSNPAWERRLLEHPQAGPVIRGWRERGAIPLRGKLAATLLMGASASVAIVTLASAWRWLPLAVAAVLLPWIWTRPSR